MLILAALVVPACGSEVFSVDAGSSPDAGDAAALDDAAADARADAGEFPDVPEAGEPTDASDAAATRLLAFVTTGGFADVTTAAAADTKCNLEAAGRVPPGKRFIAWFSSATTPAPSRLVNRHGAPVLGPWYLIDGSRLVGDRDALSKTMIKPLEHAFLTLGDASTAASVWTGTQSDGGVGRLCPGSGSATSGTANQTGPAWTDQTFFDASCGASLSVYCFQVD